AGSFDLSFMRCIPGMVIMAPADENECRQMLYTGFRYQGPAAVRYPRGKGPGVEIQEKMTAIPLGKSLPVRQGKNIAILAFGSMVEPCKPVAEQLNATLINMRFVKPLDKRAILSAAQEHSALVTVEENAIAGGAGSGINELLAAEGVTADMLNIGLDDNYIQHGTREECLHQAGLDSEGIHAKIIRRFGADNHHPVPETTLRQSGA
ncbi:MAG: 1-deoxy-D-xylulose-5-phosphate synthase, partial [Gammaproteobacteria bacterium]|nr:1-deoxy-D-xylulose-5-phosphate synthase [Gammaproteobacteria bacterium]